MIVARSVDFLRGRKAADELAATSAEAEEEIAF